MSTSRFLSSIILGISLIFIFSGKVLAQESEIVTVNSYELFWPITAGKVMGEQFYFLKSLKENIREMFIFSDLKKAEHNMTLSEKRTVESEKLFIESKDYQNGKLSLQNAQQKREMAINFLEKAQEEGKNTIEQKNRIVSSFERQRELLNYLSTQVPGQERGVIDENISKLNSVLSALE